MNIRFYNNKNPIKNEIVFVKVTKKSGDLGFYCKLLEYGGLEGFIELKNLKRGRIRSIRQLIEVDKEMYLRVIAIDVKKDKTLITLSKKGMKKEYKKQALDKTNVLKLFLKLLKEIEYMYHKKESKEFLEQEIMKHTLWRIQEEDESNDLVKLYDKILNNPRELVSSDFFSESFQDLYVKTFENRLIKTNAIIEQDFKLLSYDSVKVIKDLLHKIDDEKNVNVFIKSSPLYSIRCFGSNIDETKNIIENTINNIKGFINRNYLEFNVIGEPNVIAREQTTITFLSEHEINKMELGNNTKLLE